MKNLQVFKRILFIQTQLPQAHLNIRYAALYILVAPKCHEHDLISPYTGAPQINVGKMMNRDRLASLEVDKCMQRASDSCVMHGTVIIFNIYSMAGQSVLQQNSFTTHTRVLPHKQANNGTHSHYTYTIPQGT